MSEAVTHFPDKKLRYFPSSEMPSLLNLSPNNDITILPFSPNSWCRDQSGWKDTHTNPGCQREGQCSRHSPSKAWRTMLRSSTADMPCCCLRSRLSSLVESCSRSSEWSVHLRLMMAESGMDNLEGLIWIGCGVSVVAILTV